MTSQRFWPLYSKKVDNNDIVIVFGKKPKSWALLSKGNSSVRFVNVITKRAEDKKLVHMISNEGFHNKTVEENNLTKVQINQFILTM